MPNAEFDALVEDIKTRGLDKPIIIYDDEVLDGWHRYRACLQAGVQPRVTEFRGTIEEATALVVSANVRRRHLDTGQLALFTVEHLLPKFEAEARERERAGKKHPQFPGTEGPSEAAAVAGKVTGVSASSVKRAKLVMKHGTPEDIEAVRTGKKPLKTVTAQVQARRTSPAPASNATIRTTESVSTSEEITSAKKTTTSPIEPPTIEATQTPSAQGKSPRRHRLQVVYSLREDMFAALERVRREVRWADRERFLGVLSDYRRMLEPRAWSTKTDWERPLDVDDDDSE